MPAPTTFNTFIEAQARALRAGDTAPTTRMAWEARKAKLRAAMFAAMGPFPDKPCALEPRLIGTLKRPGYRIEKLIFQSRPDVWVTASAYVPEPARGKRPAVLVVHGHWAGARRDPVVQARCLGLVHLGFFVLAVDAFSAGERHPARAGYHGALFGSTLWPAGHTLLGLQVYDNRRAVDYLISRPEVDADRLGITGASGGGNQSMYAGGLDERFKAVVPVCSVGRYLSYLRAACCVCEVLPGALRFTEEGDVLGLVAPRGLLVINATRDAYQFSVEEAKQSLQRTKAIYKLYSAEEKVRHDTFESPHAYNQAMREAMYGWMTRWLKNEGAGKPIPEPKHTIEKLDDLACFPDGKRPAGFLFPPTFAAREAQRLLAGFRDPKLDHKEAWEAKVVQMRAELGKALGPMPKLVKPVGKFGKAEKVDGARSEPLELTPEPGLSLAVTVRSIVNAMVRPSAVLLLHPEGKAAALKHPLATELLKQNWIVYAPDLRATGASQPKGNAVAAAPDHNSAEHALWIGRPLLGQWLVDVRCALAFLATQPGLSRTRLTVIGLGQAGLVALVAGGLIEQATSVALVGAPVSWITPAAYPKGTRMGLLAPGILRAGDVAHLAGLVAPRKLLIAGGTGPDGSKLLEKALQSAFAFTRKVYRLGKVEAQLTVRASETASELGGLL